MVRKTKRSESREEFDGLYELAARLQAIKEHARKLGMFTDDRELLECTHCGLKEDVTCEGFLYTHRAGAIGDDTGLRFPEPDEEGVSRCPACESEVRGEW